MLPVLLVLFLGAWIVMEHQQEMMHVEALWSAGASVVTAPSPKWLYDRLPMQRREYLDHATEVSFLDGPDAQAAEHLRALPRLTYVSVFGELFREPRGQPRSADEGDAVLLRLASLANLRSVSVGAEAEISEKGLILISVQVETNNPGPSREAAKPGMV